MTQLNSGTFHPSKLCNLLAIETISGRCQASFTRAVWFDMSFESTCDW